MGGYKIPKLELLLTDDRFTTFKKDSIGSNRFNKKQKGGLETMGGIKLSMNIIERIQVNIPFTWLYESYMDIFLKHKLNPEIGFDAFTLDNFNLSQFKGIADKLNDHGLRTTFHAPFVDLSPGSPDAMILDITRKRFEQLTNLICVFKPKSIVCHTGFDFKRYNFIKDKWFEKALSTFIWFAKIVNDKGSKLMIENVYEQGPYEMISLFKELKNLNVGFCLDTGHQAVFGTSLLEEWINSLGSFIGQFHLHDNFGKKDEHLGMGKGIIDFSKLFNFLKYKKDSPPIITLEPHDEKELWVSLEYLQKFSELI